MGNKLTRADGDIGTNAQNKADIKSQRYKYSASVVGDDSPLIPEDEEDTDDNGVDMFSNIDPRLYHLPFTNLVFEGGGAKGIAYCGAVKYLEEIGVLPNITRFAGASVGAIAASALALGFSPDELRELFNQNLKELLYDESWFALLPNVITKYGWHSGNKFEGWLADVIGRKTGNPDISFKEVKRRYGHELCIVITNLSLMKTEYCHPKTTPDMSVVTAMRMSMSIPGLFQAKKHKVQGRLDTFIDGGILCNFPLHCFDGWYLSMKKENNFFRRLHTPSREALSTVYHDRFKEEETNMKTLGLIMFEKNEDQVLKQQVQERFKPRPRRPKKETKLYQKYVTSDSEMRNSLKIHEKLVEAAKQFTEVLEKHNLDDNNVIDKKELENALKDEMFSEDSYKLLFGDSSPDEICQLLDLNKDGEIHYTELMSFLEEHDVVLQNNLLGFRRVEIKSFGTFLGRFISSLMNNVYSYYIQPGDIERTIGIDTGYVGVTDFILEEDDKNFLEQRGYNACKSFIQRFISEHQCETRERTAAVDS